MKLIKMNALIKIYIHLHNIEEPITLNKSQNNDKNNNYTKPTTRQMQVNLVIFGLNASGLFEEKNQQSI